METRILSQLGFNDSEIRVYMALLEFESSSVGPIVKRARVQDSKIYTILQKLIEKGLVSYVIKNNTKYFQASDPNNLIVFLNEKQEQIKEQKELIKKELIPIIKERKRIIEDEQEATVFEGMEGIKAAFNYVLSYMNRGEEYDVFLLGEEYASRNAIIFFNDYHKKRIEKGVGVKFISQIEAKNIIKKYHNYRLMKYKVTKQKLPIGTVIFNGHVMTVVWGEKPSAFIIKSRKNYSYYKTFFEDVWKSAEIVRV